jgi:hypothetical protein
MVTTVRKTQEEEVVEMLKREGFRELSKSEIQREPYKTIYKLPECFKKNKQKKQQGTTANSSAKSPIPQLNN